METEVACAKVSVLIPTFNRAQMLIECLDSVLAQTIPPWQVLVINDGSTDDTRQALQPYMGRIEYIETPNGGKAAALNLGLARVTGEYVWTMDDDDVALPEALQTHLDVLTSDPSIGFTYTSGCIGRTKAGGSGIEILSSQPLPDISEESLLVWHMVGCFFYHDALVARSECYASVGPFDPALTRCQDVEMVIRLARRFRGRGINRPTVIVRQHAGIRGTSGERFIPEQRAAKTRQYEARIFTAVLLDMDIREFLPPRLRDQPLGPEIRRRAHLARMSVAVGRGLFREMQWNLVWLMCDADPASSLSAAERRLISSGFNHVQPGDAVLADRGIARAFRRRCTGPLGRQILIEVSRGLFWRAHYAQQVRNYRFLAQILWATWRLVGWRGAVLAFGRKLREVARA